MYPYRQASRLIIGFMALMALIVLSLLVPVIAFAAKAPSPPPSDPAAFVQAASQAGLLELEAARVAMNASSNPTVKSFADRMIVDHGKANAELAAIAMAKSIPVPAELDAEGARKLKALRDKSPQDFDAAYAAQMLDDHAAAVALFQANISSSDGELAAFVGRTLPVLEQHHHLAGNLKINLKTDAKKH
jgi:putative membrane protein